MKIIKIIVKNLSMVNYYIVFCVLIIINYNIDKLANDKPILTSPNIKVHIDGAINNPGLYDLSPDSKLNDVIKLSEGLVNHNPDCINLSQNLSDGQKIVITDKDSPCGDNSQLDKVNINTATILELQLIDGIGEKKAADIISYRNSNGGFTHIEQLLEIKGIGEKTFKKISSFVEI